MNAKETESYKKLFDEFADIVGEYIDTDKVKSVYDIGAGNCRETVWFRDKFVNATIHAFECNPACICDCSKNIANLDRIVFIPICVNNYTGLTHFHPINQEKTKTTHEDGNPRASSLYIAKPGYPHETYVQDEITIPCMEIKDMIELFEIPSPEIIWMDLQGAEFLALQGLGDLSGVKIIQTEATRREMYVGGIMYPEIKKYIEDKGFVCAVEGNPDAWFSDMVFIRKDIYG